MAAAAAVGKDNKGGGGRGVVVKKNCWSIFSILMFGREALCPDGLFVPAVFQELGFYVLFFEQSYTLSPLDSKIEIWVMLVVPLF